MSYITVICNDNTYYASPFESRYQQDDFRFCSLRITGSAHLRCPGCASGYSPDKRWGEASKTTLSGINLLLFRSINAEINWALLPTVISSGRVWECTFPLHTFLLNLYFGNTNPGSIIGFSVGITTFGIMPSTPLTVWIFEKFGDYLIACLAPSLLSHHRCYQPVE